MIKWYPDANTSHHITPYISSLQITEEYKGNDRVIVGNGNGLPISHVGYGKLHINGNKSLSLRNILHVPKITKLLLSVKKLCHDNNCFFEFHPNH